LQAFRIFLTTIMIWSSCSFGLEHPNEGPSNENLLQAKPGIGNAAPSRMGTTRFVFEGNRIFAELEFVLPDGGSHRCLAFVDLGSPRMTVSLSLFRELGLNQKKSLIFRVGEMPVTLSSSEVQSSPSPSYPLGDLKVEAILSADILQNFQVVIDYKQRTLTLAQPNSLAPLGTPVPLRLNHKTGLAIVDAMIDGKLYPVTIDSGSGYTWLQKTVAQEWLTRHSEWERGIGAVGVSNMRMSDDGIEASGTLMRISEIQLGALHIRQVGALAIGPDERHSDFIDCYSKKNVVPVIGWLGGNVLQQFRIMLDYPNQISYWSEQSAPDSHDLDQIGLTLAFKRGGYFVAAIATQKGKPTVDGVRIGDRLLQVDELKVDTATWGTIFTAMHGKPGETRTLTLQRNGEKFTAKAIVQEF